MTVQNTTLTTVNIETNTLKHTKSFSNDPMRYSVHIITASGNSKIANKAKIEDILMRAKDDYGKTFKELSRE